MLKNQWKPLKISENGAFTLAEVLITLGIIGVVAAMTIPTLMNATSDKENVARIKKIYSEIYSATTSMQTDNGSIWDSSSADSKQNSSNMKDAYKQYLKSVKDGTIDTIVTITWSAYKSSTAVVDDRANTNRYGMVLPSGAILRFYSSQNCTGVPLAGSFSVCGDISVDVNGNQKPNMYGKDVYNLIIVKDTAGNYKTLPDGETIGYTCVAGSTTQETSYGCTQKVILGEALP